jgi:hypothetical protein
MCCPITNAAGDIYMIRNHSNQPVLAGGLLAFIFLCAGIIALSGAQSVRPYEPTFVLVEQCPSPVIDQNSPGAGDIEYGFEGGSVIKIDGVYHLFSTEMMSGPMWVKTRMPHWASPDRIHWKRVSTLYESSGDFTGKDPRASLWAPMPIYNKEEGRWDLFYVAYTCAPSTKTEWLGNYNGRIWRAVSKVKGYGGIGGPYQDVGVILQPDAQSQPWEGLQGTDSFFPYQVGKRWLGFYGSANTEHLPMEHWRAGLAEAAALSGPWKRRSEGNPVTLEKRFAENPVVTRLANGYYVAVYDNDLEYPNAIGYTWSGPGDGVHWVPGKPIVVQPKGKGFWADTVRTPLGLIPEGHSEYTLFYTGYKKSSEGGHHRYCGVGFVTLKQIGAGGTGAGEPR